jgi:hypothetical protein
MSEELNQAAAADEGGSASEEAGAPGAAPDAGAVSGDSTLEGLSPEVQAAVKAQVQTEVRAAQEALQQKYEGPEGDVAKLKSQRDKLKNRLAAVERAEREQALAQHQTALSLRESDPERAAAMALEQNQQLLSQQQVTGQREEAVDWVVEVMRDMGYDLDDAENMKLAESQAQRLIDGARENTNYAYAVQQELAKGISESKDEKITALTKELQDTKDSIAGLVKDEVTRAFASVGNVPDGSAPGAAGGQDAWRSKSPAQKRKDGLAERRRRAAAANT